MSKKEACVSRAGFLVNFERLGASDSRWVSCASFVSPLYLMERGAFDAHGTQCYRISLCGMEMPPPQFARTQVPPSQIHGAKESLLLRCLKKSVAHDGPIMSYGMGGGENE